MLIDEIIYLKNDMLEYCVENIFLFSFCYLYRPRNLKRNFFIVYTERFSSIHLKYYICDINTKNNIRNKCLKISKKGYYYISRRKIDFIRREHINKPIIVLNPSVSLKKNNTQKDAGYNNNNNVLLGNEYNISIGNIN